MAKLVIKITNGLGGVNLTKTFKTNKEAMDYERMYVEKFQNKKLENGGTYMIWESRFVYTSGKTFIKKYNPMG